MQDKGTPRWLKTLYGIFVPLCAVFYGIQALAFLFGDGNKGLQGLLLVSSAICWLITFGFLVNTTRINRRARQGHLRWRGDGRMEMGYRGSSRLAPTEAWHQLLTDLADVFAPERQVQHQAVLHQAGVNLNKIPPSMLQELYPNDAAAMARVRLGQLRQLHTSQSFLAGWRTRWYVRRLYRQGAWLTYLMLCTNPVITLDIHAIIRAKKVWAETWLPLVQLLPNAPVVTTMTWERRAARLGEDMVRLCDILGQQTVVAKTLAATTDTIYTPEDLRPYMLRWCKTYKKLFKPVAYNG